MAAAIFLRTVRENGKVIPASMMAKTKLSTLKTVSVAKFQRNATVLGVRLAKYVEEGTAREMNRRVF